MLVQVVLNVNPSQFPGPGVKSIAAIAAKRYVKTSLINPGSNEQASHSQNPELISAVQHMQTVHQQHEVSSCVVSDGLKQQVTVKSPEGSYDQKTALPEQQVDSTTSAGGTADMTDASDGLQQRLAYAEKQLVDEISARQALQQQCTAKALAAEDLQQQLNSNAGELAGLRKRCFNKTFNWVSVWQILFATHEQKLPLYYMWRPGCA